MLGLLRIVRLTRVLPFTHSTTEPPRALAMATESFNCRLMCW